MLAPCDTHRVERVSVPGVGTSAHIGQTDPHVPAARDGPAPGTTVTSWKHVTTVYNTLGTTVTSWKQVTTVYNNTLGTTVTFSKQASG
jgi:hypothetical protein